MCLIAIAWKLRADLPLALIANRDEHHDRPATPAAADPDAADVYGGRDLLQGGGWLQASSRRRLAAVTNVRHGAGSPAASRSRGWLVRDFVRGDLGAEAFANELQATAGEYGSFNLLLWDGDVLWAAGNHPCFSARPVSAGLHAMSNGAFDADWPKSVAASNLLGHWIGKPVHRSDAPLPALTPLFDGLRSTRQAPDHQLPDTGVGLELERRLSPPFILDPRYGTRCSSIVLAGDAGLWFSERRFDRAGEEIDTTRHHLAR